MERPPTGCCTPKRTTWSLALLLLVAILVALLLLGIFGIDASKQLERRLKAIERAKSHQV